MSKPKLIREVIAEIQKRHRLDEQSLRVTSQDERLRERMIHADRATLLALGDEMANDCQRLPCVDADLDEARQKIRRLEADALSLCESLHKAEEEKAELEAKATGQALSEEQRAAWMVVHQVRLLRTRVKAEWHEVFLLGPLFGALDECEAAIGPNGERIVEGLTCAATDGKEEQS